jgi:hypothetical protein
VLLQLYRRKRSAWIGEVMIRPLPQSLLGRGRAVARLAQLDRHPVGLPVANGRVIALEHRGAGAFEAHPLEQDAAEEAAAAFDRIGSKLMRAFMV